MLGKRTCPFRRTTSMSLLCLSKADKDDYTSSASLDSAAEPLINKQVPQRSSHRKQHLQAESVLDTETPHLPQLISEFTLADKEEGSRKDQFVDKAARNRKIAYGLCSDGEAGGDEQKDIFEADVIWAVQEKLNISENGRSVVVPMSFLEVCFFCKKPLRQQQDIFIYRGDSAFCSEEYRYRHIQIDEERCASRCNKAASSQTVVGP